MMSWIGLLSDRYSGAGAGRILFGEGVSESEEQGAPSETLPEPVVAASEGPSPADPAPDSIGLDCLKQAKLVNQTSQDSFPDTHYWKA